jgi:hypothetical protein
MEPILIGLTAAQTAEENLVDPEVEDFSYTQEEPQVYQENILPFAGVSTIR